MDAEPVTEVWLTIGAAAEVAGVARRSAFRWVARGTVPVRQVGGRRLIEVAALRARAAGVAGAKQTMVAQCSATVEAAATSPPPAPARLPADTEVLEALSALSEVVTSHEDMFMTMWNRVERIERHLGLQP